MRVRINVRERNRSKCGNRNGINIRLKRNELDELIELDFGLGKSFYWWLPGLRKGESVDKFEVNRNSLIRVGLWTWLHSDASNWHQRKFNWRDFFSDIVTTWNDEWPCNRNRSRLFISKLKSSDEISGHKLNNWFTPSCKTFKTMRVK